MQKKLSVAIILVLSILMANAAFALDKEELKKTLNEMSVDDYGEVIKNINEKALKTAEDTGYVNFYGSANVGGSGGYYVYFPSAINQNKPAGLDDITSLQGGGGGFTVNMSKNWAWGVEFGGMGGISAKKNGANYTEYGVGAGYIIPYVKYKPIINPQWIVDLNLGAGYLVGGYTQWTSNETVGGVTEIHRYGSVIPIKAEAELRYRINPVWFVGLKGGYLWANISELRRANLVDPAARPLDFSGAYAAITMGGNF